LPHTPFALGFALVPAEGTPTLFLDRAEPGPEAENRRADVRFARIPDVAPALEALGKAGASVWVDPATSPIAMIETLKSAGATLIEKGDPAQLPKARKNPAELAGMREAHVADGVAMAKFLAWFDTEAPKGRLTEIDIVAALEAFRREGPAIADISFDTISGAGPNGAIVHYRVTEATNRKLVPGEPLLVDSGGQYLMGTTDITRTLATGPVTAEQKDRYTRVLKGMIAISRARFPKGTAGAQLDVLARQFLWQDGVTYNHGTGHGVGAFLSVHEGPIGLSPRYTTPFEPGNILSNEPGYYKTGEYGIRIENLVHVVDAAAFPGYLEFETLTLAPIDTRLIDGTLLDAGERDWLNAYHARVMREIGPLVAGEVKTWLQAATRPI